MTMIIPIKQILSPVRLVRLIAAIKNSMNYKHNCWYCSGLEYHPWARSKTWHNSNQQSRGFVSSRQSKCLRAESFNIQPRPRVTYGCSDCVPPMTSVVPSRWPSGPPELRAPQCAESASSESPWGSAERARWCEVPESPRSTRSQLCKSAWMCW